YSEIINYENNLSSPFEKKENKNTLVNNPKTNIPENKKDYLDKINTEILALIINEELDNREEAIKYIKNLPGVKINRIRKNQISIKCDFFDDKPIILKGDIYEEGRNYSDYRKQFNSTIERDPRIVRSEIDRNKAEFAERIEKRKSRNRSKFKNSQSKNKPENTKNIKGKNSNIEYRSINNNIDFTVNNNGFTDINDNIFDMEKIKNESINTEYKAKTATEEERRIARKRDLEQINQQQQLIKRRIEEVRRTDSQLSKSVETTGERLRRDRRSLQSIIYNARRHIRTLSIYFRKNEHKRYFEEKKRLEEEKQFNQRRRKKFIY
ncbi:TPA: hypothetical protein ACJJXT_004805, partial [Enterobacter hormaechei subsp. hoffmannii]